MSLKTGNIYCLLFCILHLLDITASDSVTWGLEDHHTKRALCFNVRCDVAYGQVVRAIVKLIITGSSWYKPQVFIRDLQHAFLGPNSDQQMYYLCPSGKNYQTSLFDCNFTAAKPGTYNFGFTLTALARKPGTYNSTIRVHMDYGLPRVKSGESYTVFVN